MSNRLAMHCSCLQLGRHLGSGRFLGVTTKEVLEATTEEVLEATAMTVFMRWSKRGVLCGVEGSGVVMRRLGGQRGQITAFAL